MSMELSTVPPAWRDVLAQQLDSDAFRALAAFVADERARANVFPPEAQVFAALALTSPDAIKAVLLGQDPYPTLGNANGLAFSVAPGKKIPASLRNIFRGVALDVGIAEPSSGDLTPWAKAGVLLLNTVLTVREGEAGSHRKRGWEAITTAIVRAVDALPGPIVYLAFGAHAQALLVEQRQPVLALPHPSPLNGKAFVVAVQAQRPFTRTNEILVAGGRSPIDWRL